MITKCPKCKGKLTPPTVTFFKLHRVTLVWCLICGHHLKAAEVEVIVRFIKERDKPKQSWLNAKKLGKKITICKCCKRQQPIVSRGLCGNCYRKAKLAGTLNILYPAKPKGQAV